jgi:hypothetical protein
MRTGLVTSLILLFGVVPAALAQESERHAGSEAPNVKPLLETLSQKQVQLDNLGLNTTLKLGILVPGKSISVEGTTEDVTPGEVRCLIDQTNVLLKPQTRNDLHPLGHQPEKVLISVITIPQNQWDGARASHWRQHPVPNYSNYEGTETFKWAFFVAASPKGECLISTSEDIFNAILEKDEIARKDELRRQRPLQRLIDQTNQVMDHVFTTITGMLFVYMHRTVGLPPLDETEPAPPGPQSPPSRIAPQQNSTRPF